MDYYHREDLAVKHKLDDSPVTQADMASQDFIGAFLQEHFPDIPIISEEDAKKLGVDYFLVLPWHFKDNIIKREKEFLANGGKLIFPLPNIEIIGL